MRHRKGLRERQKPKRKERIGEGSEKMGREVEEKEGERKRIRGSKYGRQRDTILENSL